MTVCIATDGSLLQPGGISTFNRHLVSLLTEAGHKVIVLYIEYDSDEADDITKEGNLIKVVLRNSYRQYYKKWQPYFRPGGFDAPNWIAIGLSMKDWLIQHHRNYSIDIIEVSDYGGAGIFLCDPQLPPVVVTGHGSLLQFSGLNYVKNDDSARVVKRLEELSFRYADTVIAHSPLNKSDLADRFKREIALAPMPWRFNPSENISPDTLPAPELLVVGGLQPVKGIYDIMETMRILKNKAPRVALEWVGGDTWLAPGHQKMSLYLQQKYPELWQQSFQWVNEIPHNGVMEKIRAAGIVIIPSVFETFNYIALEAAALKKPVIITDKAGASCLFTHERDAWIVPSNAPAAMADAILHLLAHPELGQTLGENASLSVNREFIAGKILSERLRIYAETIEKRVAEKQNNGQPLSFLDTYRTSRRKYYYCIRRLIKKMIGRG